MSVIYVSDPKTRLNLEENRIIATYEDGSKSSFPIAAVESISFLTRAHITIACLEECLKVGIPVSFMTRGGHYFGRLLSSGHVNAELQRKQSNLYNTEFSLNFSKIIISAKIKNQLTILRRYAKSKNVDISELRQNICAIIPKITYAENLSELMGYEGQCAKLYFSGLSKCIEEKFAFKGRTRRPPKDPFNSLISLGYTILMNEIYNEIENKGLNPYFGFMHQDHEKHPTLASDLVEEWRAPLIDSLAMSLINGHELLEEHFIIGTIEKPGCFLTKEGLKIFLKKLEKKLQTKVSYLSYAEYPVTFRRAIALQVARLAQAITEGDASIYEPLIVR